jgi:hypothetical protein
LDSSKEYDIGEEKKEDEKDFIGKEMIEISIYKK